MSRRDLSNRIIDQFSERGDRADIWRAFDLLLPTDRFLNMGYSGRYQSHVFGSPQLRLVERVMDELSSMDDGWADGIILDLGCGRGGAATCLPFDPNTFSACVAIDSIVYMPDKPDVFTEISRVLEPDGACVVSDLLAAPENDLDDQLQQFADAWDLLPLWTLERYLSTIESANLRVTYVTDLTPCSLKRFRKWTTLYLLLADGPLGHVLANGLARQGLDPERISEQIRAAHGALRNLQHVLVVLRGADTRD